MARTDFFPRNDIPHQKSPASKNIECLNLLTGKEELTEHLQLRSRQLRTQGSQGNNECQFNSITLLSKEGLTLFINGGTKTTLPILLA